MKSVSPRFKAALGYVNRWVTVVEWSNDGGQSWTTAKLVSGSVTSAATSQIRHSTSLVLRDVPIGREGLNPYVTRIRIRQGIAFGPDDVELIGMGVYRVNSVSRSLLGGDVSVSGGSFESYLIDARFVAARNVTAAPAFYHVERFIREILPSAGISWRGESRYQLIPKMITEKDRWGLIDGATDSPSIARAIGARIYANADGIFVVEPVPTLDDEPTWTSATGPGGLLVDSTQNLESAGVYNMMVVWGESTEGDKPPVGPAIAIDRDPLSLTNALRSVDVGGFGERPKFYTSSLITTLEQARTTAQAMLAPLLGLKQSVSFTSLHDPTMEPGDVGLVTTPDGPQKMIIDSITHNLLGGTMSCETRATSTRLAGDIAEAPADEGGE